MLVSLLFSMGLWGLLGCLPDVGEEPVVPSFAEVRDQVLLPSCGFSSCHGGGAGGLTLEEGGVFDALVGVPSLQVSELLLVAEGLPEESYLMLKLDDSAEILGDPMPPGGGMESQRIEMVRSWIEAGALED